MSAQPVTSTTARDRAPSSARRVPAAAEAPPPRVRPVQPPGQALGSTAGEEPKASESVPEPGPAPSGRSGLCALLAETAYVHPGRIALIDPADKRAWSRRPPITWTYAAAAEIVARLANGLRSWRLPRASRIGLFLGGGAESVVAYLAIEAAGHSPCLLPPAWSEDDLVTAVQAAGITAILCQAQAGDAAPAETMRRVALRYFGLRYLAAFGPDVPDGVISLDGMALDTGGGPFAVDTGGGLVSFAGGDPSRPVHRSTQALLAAIALHRTRTGILPGDRILQPASAQRPARRGHRPRSGPDLRRQPGNPAGLRRPRLCRDPGPAVADPSRGTRRPRAEPRGEPPARDPALAHPRTPGAVALSRPAPERREVLPGGGRGRLRRDRAPVGHPWGRRRRPDPRRSRAGTAAPDR